MKYRVVAVLLFVSCMVGSVNAREAKVFMVKRQGAKEIVVDRGHITVRFTTGWISKRDSLFMTIFSNATKLTAEASAAGTYFDGEQLKNAWIVENADIGHNLDRPWGVANKDLLSDIPADTANVTFTIKMAAYKEDRFKQMIDAFKGAQPTSPPTGFSLTIEPYMTYASIADALFGTLFGTNRATYPLLIETGLFDNSVISANGIYEHYIVAIAPNTDGDAWLRNLDATKLRYDEASVDLKYEGNSVRDHTYAVIWVGSAPQTDIPKMLFNSKAAWAVLALVNFYNTTLPEITAKEDVPRFDKAMVQQLGACIDQLKRELRFSAFDRAKALLAFSERSRKMITAACAARNISSGECKTPQIDTFEDGVSSTFGIKSPETKSMLQDAGKRLSLDLNKLVQPRLQ